MTPMRLLLRNLLYHWRGNSAVFLGVVVGATVLTGALLVGDSLRGSLRDLTLRRLGWVDQALVTGRFFRREATANLPAEHLSPAIVLRGTASVPEDERHVRSVNIYGVDATFWPNKEQRGKLPQPLLDLFGVPTALGDSIVEVDGVRRVKTLLNRTLADDLRITKGQKATLRVPKAGAVPPESLLGRRDASDVVDEIQIVVNDVLADEEFGARFNLQPAADAPRNAFMPLAALRDALGGGDRVNAIFVGGASADLQDRFNNRLTLDDWGLTLQDPESRTDALFARLDKDHDGKLSGPEWLRKVEGRPQPTPAFRSRFAHSIASAIAHKDPDVLERAEVERYFQTQRDYLSLESRQLLIEPAVEKAALAAAEDAGLRAAPTLVYLADTLSDGKNEVPYVVVAALDPTEGPPLGPFLPRGVSRLEDDQIVLTEWDGSPIDARPGTPIILSYYPPEQHGEFTLDHAAFKLAGTIPMSGPVADPNLTPDFPGVTDKASIRDWNPPFPFDDTRIKPGDANERFWDDYRAAPRAYVNLAVGQKLWGSRFGRLTSIRLAPKEGVSLDAAEAAFRESLYKHLQPSQGGFVFQPVKEQALQASAGSTDFTGLFLGFSFFLIAAALLLVGLLFRLNLDRRAEEIGLLMAVGYRRWTIRWLLLGEGVVLATAGAVVGCAAAVAYAALLVQFLGAVWPGGALQSFLRPHYTLFSLTVGGAAALVVSVLTILWAAFVLGRAAPSALLAGANTAEGEAVARRRGGWSWWIALVSAIGAAGLLVCGLYVTDAEGQAMTFFGAGALLLTACLAAVSGWLRGSGRGAVEGHGWWGVARLGVRNAARHPTRSLLTAGLLASAAFLIVAVEAFRRQADPGDAGPTSPSGGFALVAESDLPIYQDLNSDKGRTEITDKLEVLFRKQTGGDPGQARARAEAAGDLLSRTKVVAFRVHEGDDASCLNLYEPRRPRLLGVPESLMDGDTRRFVFADSEAKTKEERDNPWKVLRRPDPPYPAFGEQNSVVWILKKGLGDEVETPAADGSPQKLRVAGLLQDSVFQSGLLLSEENFLKLYPAQEGYNLFLIETPPGREEEVRNDLNLALGDRGFEAAPTAQRLQTYLAVENTYLSTFQALGGLGLILGSLGLAVVLLRGVWERRGELALLRALGFRRTTLGWLVLAENGFLLLLGLAAGTASALAAAAPHLLHHGGETPWLRLAVLLAGVLVIGLAVGATASAASLRAPLIRALRRE